jgi:hypothetical protein
MARHPQESLPGQNRQWADLKAAYRFLNNPRVDPDRMGQMHRRLTRLACREHPTVLCIQDDSDLSAVHIDSDEHLMHHTLAVLPDGRLLGILDQRFFERVQKPVGETRRQRASRWRESDVWQDAVQATGHAPAGVRFIHVADRAADHLRFMHACERQGCGFVVRARQDRRVNQATDKLWSSMQQLTPATCVKAVVGKQSGHANHPARQGREVQLTLRYGPVRLDEPSNSHETHDGPLEVHAVYLLEENAPANQPPVEWMLLTNLPLTCLADALEVVSHYRHRWVIEEWHRALKEGCRLESSQLTEASALYRLAAMQAVMAVRLIQLRDLADASKHQDDKRVVHRWLGKTGVELIALLAGVRPDELTAAIFWRTIAHQGGWIGRKSDGRPGWKVIWRGWRQIQPMIFAVELMDQQRSRRQSNPTPKTTPRSSRSCG